MPQKTVITEVKEMEKTDGISLYFPQNKVLYVDQFTGHEPDTADERKVFSPRTIDDVFGYYKPCVERIFLSNEDGNFSYEDFYFGCVDDFDDDKLISQSETLSNSLYKRDTYYAIIRLLERSRDLRCLLSDAKAKIALKNVFKAMRAELSENPKD